MKRNILLFVALITAGCSAHDPLLFRNTNDIEEVAEASRYPAHTNRVFVTESSLADEANYETLATFEVGKATYGSTEEVLQSFADEARKIGADAVIEVKTWHQVSGWSWAAPHGSGKAVKLTQPDEFDFTTLEGAWK